jgi:hypothetical protein
LYSLATRLFHEGEIQFVLYVFISIKRRVCFSFHALQERFARWIKPQMTSLLLGTLADMTRGKAELLAENVLLRHQLIILRRQVKRPVYWKTDRLLLVLLARIVRTWKQAHITRSARNAPPLASPGIQALWEIQVQSSFCQTSDLRRDRGFDQGDGEEQSVLGSRTYAWRIAQAGASRLPAAPSRST